MKIYLELNKGEREKIKIFLNICWKIRLEVEKERKVKKIKKKKQSGLSIFIAAAVIVENVACGSYSINK